MKYLLFGIIIGLLIGFYTSRTYYKCEELPPTKQKMILEAKKEQYKEKINIFENRSTILQKQKSTIKITPVSELKKDSDNCDTLINEISKRDDIIDLDSLVVLNKDSTIFEQKSFIETQDTLINDSEKEIATLEKKVKKQSKFIKIVTTIAVVSLIILKFVL